MLVVMMIVLNEHATTEDMIRLQRELEQRREVESVETQSINANEGRPVIFQP